MKPSETKTRKQKNKAIRMPKILRYTWLIFKVSLNRDLQFQSAFWGYFFLALIWFVQVYILTFVITQKFGTIADWNPEEMFILTSTWGLINSLTTAFCINLFYLPYAINRGELDGILLKPIHSIIGSSLSSFGINNLLIAICYTTILAILVPETTILKLSGFIVFCTLGIMIQYFIWFMIITTTFHAGSLDGTFDLLAIMRNIGRYPQETYNKVYIVIQILLMPFIIFASVPASILVDKFSIKSGIIYIITLAIISTMSIYYWKFSIKRYSSASS